MRVGWNGHTITVKQLIIGVGAIVTALAAILTKGNDVWRSTGWETPRGHDADIDAASVAVQEFRDLWQCDELEELLDDLQVAPVIDVDRIERVKDRMGEGPSGLRCARFEN